MSKYSPCARTCLLLIIATVMPGSTISADAQSAEEQVVHVTVHLRDGSHLLGTLEDPRQLPLQADFGNVSVPLELVSVIEALEDRESVHVLFKNGDRLSAVPTVEAFTLTTIVGAVSIPFSAATRMELASQGRESISEQGAKAPACPCAYTFHEFNGHYYALSRSTTWEASEAEAVSLGGHLVAITNAEEQDFINETFLAGPSSGDVNTHRWIGLTDRRTEGQFEWTTGEPFDFRFWDSGEPNNSDDEDFVFMNWGPILGRWNDSVNDARVGGGVIELNFNPAMRQHSASCARPIR